MKRMHRKLPAGTALLIVLICAGLCFSGSLKAQETPEPNAGQEDQAESYEDIADGYFDQRDFENAAEYYVKAIEQDPGNAILQYNLAMSLKELKSCKAAEHFEEYLYLADDPEDEKRVEQWIESIEDKCKAQSAKKKKQKKEAAREKDLNNTCSMASSGELVSKIAARSGTKRTGKVSLYSIDRGIGNLLKGLQALKNTEGNQVFTKMHACSLVKTSPSMAYFAFRIYDHPDHILILSFDLDHAFDYVECTGRYRKYEYLFRIGILQGEELNETSIRNTYYSSRYVFSNEQSEDWPPTFKALFKMFDRTGVNLKIDTREFDM